MKNNHSKSPNTSFRRHLKKALLSIGLVVSLIFLALIGMGQHQNNQDINPIPVPSQHE